MDEGYGAKLLAFAHPLWMLASLGCAIATARAGLVIRRRRMRSERVGAELRGRHLRLGKTAVGMVVVGFATGPPSMVLIRGRAAFDSFHGILGIIVLGLFAWTAWSGRALARGDREARGVHRVVAAAALGAAFLSAVAGFVLLP